MTEKSSPLALARLPDPPNNYDRNYQIRLNNIIELEKIQQMVN